MMYTISPRLQSFLSATVRGIFRCLENAKNLDDHDRMDPGPWEPKKNPCAFGLKNTPKTAKPVTSVYIASTPDMWPKNLRFATIGYILPEYWRFPGYLSKFLDSRRVPGTGGPGGPSDEVTAGDTVIP